jgi:uncharacterized protein
VGSGDGDLAAGEFSSWLDGLQEALHGEQGSEVPCGGCTACCRASQFIPIGPDETGTLARVPAALRFPAPGRPAGHVLLGYDEHGRCPMLVGNGCSIYEHRPRACRTYDCRVFAAAGIEPDEHGKADIARQARRWRFSFASAAAGRTRQAAVRAAARFVRDHPDGSAGAGPLTTTQVAVAAVEVRGAFLGPGGPDGMAVIEPDPGAVAVALRRRRPADREIPEKSRRSAKGPGRVGR